MKDYHNYSADIEGAKNPPFSFALSAGIDKEIERNIFFYASVNGEVSGNLYEQSAGIRLGIRYLFPVKKNAAIYKNYIAEIE